MSSLSANHTTSFFFVSGFGSGAYSAKLFAGTKQRFSGLSHMRQCGDEVLRILVTGGPPLRGGGGMPRARRHDRRREATRRASHCPRIEIVAEYARKDRTSLDVACKT